MNPHRIKLLFLVVNYLLITFECFSQTPSVSIIDDELEDIAVNNYVDEDVDWDSQMDKLKELYEQPVNVNSATREELEKFPFLTNEQVENILAYVYIHGEMKSLSELMLVEGLSVEKINLLRLFLCAKHVENPVDININKVLKNGHHELLARLGFPLYRRKGYSTSYYGPAMYQSVKYMFKYRDKISFGLVGEKDEGEPFAAMRSKAGYDFYSAHLLIKDFHLLKTFVVGDYKLNFGEGLVVNNDFCIGKSSYVFSSPFIKDAITKHSSTGESNFFRGVAATVKLGDWLVSPFYSNMMIDGNVDAEGKLTSIRTSGLHRTKGEMDGKHVASLQAAGANIEYRHNRIRLGLTSMAYWLSRDYEPERRGYSKYYIRGKTFYNVGINYGYRIRKATFSGEVAKGKSGVAFINKLRYDFSSDNRIMITQRYYSRDYWAMFANSLSAGGGIRNENGCYIAGELVPVSGFKIFASADLCTFPWLRYLVSRRFSWSSDMTLRLSYSPYGKFSIGGEYCFKRDERDVTGKSSAISEYVRHRWRVNVDYNLGDRVSMRTIADYNMLRNFMCENYNGYRITQQMSLQTKSNALRLRAQLTYFNTDNYYVRVYVSERGPLNAFYTPSFNGEGVRWSLSTRYNISRHFVAACNVGETVYFDRDIIGSGNDLINSNIKTDVMLQLQCNF